jgi:hypothetical protein
MARLVSIPKTVDQAEGGHQKFSGQVKCHFRKFLGRSPGVPISDFFKVSIASTAGLMGPLGNRLLVIRNKPHFHKV